MYDIINLITMKRGIITLRHFRTALLVTVLAVVLSFGFNFTIHAFTSGFFDTTDTPPLNNTFAPLNEGATAQTREGLLTLGSNPDGGGDVALLMGDDIDSSGIIEENELNYIVNVQHPVDDQDMATCGYVNQVLLGLTLNDCKQ